MDLDAYRAEAEAFVSALTEEHYRHFSGQKQDLALERIYGAHPTLFSLEAVERLREADNRSLLEFAVQGLIEEATRAQSAELAGLEARLELEVDGRRMPFRQAPVAQANERDADVRAAIEEARQQAVESHLNPLLLETLERSHSLVSELGWPSMSAMCAELSGIDLQALAHATSSFLDATEPAYEDVVDPQLREQLGFGFERLRRSDLPAFFRAPSLDERFPAERLLPAFESTVAGLGIGADGRIRIDAEARPAKSPRAFCAPVRVPDEVYLVIAPHGGRDDYEALLHEAGHAEHYGHVAPSLEFEHRYLGDNSVTEGFAFLFQRLAADREWLRRRLGLDEADPVEAHARAAKLVFLRRYAAKLTYELELHGGEGASDLSDVYARRLSAALHVDWPAASWLTDVDPFFYAARYLRAWALETHLTRALRERFGLDWFERREAGALLERLWAAGQAMSVTELLDAAGAGASMDGEPDLSVLLEELADPSGGVSRASS